MMGNDDGPGISFHDFNGAWASSVKFTEALFTAAVLEMNIEPWRRRTCVKTKNYMVNSVMIVKETLDINTLKLFKSSALLREQRCGFSRILLFIVTYNCINYYLQS